MTSNGKKYWRSLNELADTPDFRKWLTQEFPNQVEELDHGSRRAVLKLMAASFALGGLASCRRPSQKILPAFRGADAYIPGKPVYYATAYEHGGFAYGLLVETNDGRPTKIEGNPDHPASLGAASAMAQASVLNLYDPNRLRTPLQDGEETTWERFEQFLSGDSGVFGANGGQGLRILSTTINSPSLEGVRQELLAKYPSARWVEYDPVNYDEMVEGARAATGAAALPVWKFDQADVVLALDCDFLGVDSQSMASIRGFTSKRRINTPSDQMNRLYAVEPNFTITGASADHRMRIRPSEIQAFAQELAQAVGASGATQLNVLNNGQDSRRKMVAAIAKDLQAAQGRSLVVVGPRQPAAVHVLVHSINQALGNFGQTLTMQPVPPGMVGQMQNLRNLVAELNSGSVTHFFILGGNSAFNTPGDLKFGEAMKRARTVVHLTNEPNETSKLAQWALPETHYLEAWSDTRSIDGTVTIQQPMIEPLWGARSLTEITALLAGSKQTRGFDIVYSRWNGDAPIPKPVLRGPEGGAAPPSTALSPQWRKALHDGLMVGTAAAPAAAGAQLRRQPTTLSATTQVIPPPAAANGSRSGYEVTFYPSPAIWDGRYANNGWLQELPHPITKVSWDNAALISAKTAEELGAETGTLLSLEHGGRTITVPALIQPGHADGCISVEMGYGRKFSGHVGDGVGHDVYPLRSSNEPGFLRGVNVTKAGGTYQLVTTQEHHSMEGRDLVRSAPIDAYRANHEVVEHHEVELFELYAAPRQYDDSPQWGMVIDLTACIGCNACVIACQSENNIPIVGKEQIRRGREMHWIRLDRYYAGEVEDPQLVYQPLPCMQCENAPCENVCPVAATVHSPDGLNVMVYNRCIGTRYCSNNCPYKVRRFNYLSWHDREPMAASGTDWGLFGAPESVQTMVYNPEVTVRSRGVMEKCTYCIQRIQKAKIDAKTDGRRRIRDGEVLTACQQTCPADAIIFGDIQDPTTRVSQFKKLDLNYAILRELNVRPRTTYLAQLRNPNPELA